MEGYQMLNSTQKDSVIVNSTLNSIEFQAGGKDENLGNCNEKLQADELRYAPPYLENEETLAFGGDGGSPKSDKATLNDNDTNPASNSNLIEEDDLDSQDDAGSQKNVSINKVSSIYSPHEYKDIVDKQAKCTICLWYDGDAEDAAQFYAKTFPDSFVGKVVLAPGDFPGGKKGDVLTVEFTVMGIPCIGLNGGPGVKHNWAFSFQVATADQAETDSYWNAIVNNDGEENACGWCRDKWGLSWQITPIALTQSIADPDADAAKRAFDAMMEMQKINIMAIEAAHRG